MDRIAARNMAGPLLLLNLVMYFIVLFFASWCLNRYINGQTDHPSKPSSPTLSIFSPFFAFLSIVDTLSMRIKFDLFHTFTRRIWIFFKINLFEEVLIG